MTSSRAHRTGTQPRRPGGATENRMLYTLAIILLILWLVGLVTSYTAGGLLHILLVVAIVMVVIQLFSGRRIG